MDFRAYGEQLIEEFNMCIRAKPRHDAISVQLEKDNVAKWAYHLNNQLGWGTDNDIAEACHQLASRLEPLKEKLVLEILKNGPV